MSQEAGDIVEAVTRLWKITSGTHLIPGRSVGIFLFCEVCRPPVGLSCSVIYWVPETLSSGIKRSEREPNYLLSSVIQIFSFRYAFMKCTGRNLFLHMLQLPVMLSGLLITSGCLMARHTEVNYVEYENVTKLDTNYHPDREVQFGWSVRTPAKCNEMHMQTRLETASLQTNGTRHTRCSNPVPFKR